MNRYWLLLPLLLIVGLIVLFRPGRETTGDRASAGSSTLERRDGPRPGSASGDALPSKSRERDPRSRKIHTTASGLRYEILHEGSGPTPTSTSTVTVHYEGRLSDGSVFDQSDPQRPVPFDLTKVIAGWTEGLQLMKVGGKYRFTIPPELAYGARGAGDAVPPNATLIFDIELVDTHETVVITEGRIEMPVFSTRRIELVEPPDDLPACP